MNSINSQEGEEVFQKAVQQGRRPFGAWSVHGVREHDKGPKTPRVDFFNPPPR